MGLFEIFVASKIAADTAAKETREKIERERGSIAERNGTIERGNESVIQQGQNEKEREMSLLENALKEVETQTGVVDYVKKNNTALERLYGSPIILPENVTQIFDFLNSKEVSIEFLEKNEFIKIDDDAGFVMVPSFISKKNIDIFNLDKARSELGIDGKSSV